MRLKKLKQILTTEQGEQMLLFYSDYCNHCKMLLDTIQRMQAKTISLVSIDGLRASGKKIPPQIHSVPALMILPSKQILFGKQVFDYLLLPGKGKLVTGVERPTSSQDPVIKGRVNSSEPEAFTIYTSNNSGDNFAFIEDESSLDRYRNYTWASIDGQSFSPSQEAPVSTDQGQLSMQSNTRVKKELLDIEEYKAKRAEDLTLVVNPNVSTPPVNTY